jgi:hypothetical protein
MEILHSSVWFVDVDGRLKINGSTLINRDSDCDMSMKIASEIIGIVPSKTDEVTDCNSVFVKWHNSSPGYLAHKDHSY